MVLSSDEPSNTSDGFAIGREIGMADRGRCESTRLSPRPTVSSVPLRKVARYLPSTEYLMNVTGLSSDDGSHQAGSLNVPELDPARFFPPLPPYFPHSAMPAARVLPSGENANGERTRRWPMSA